MGTATLDVENIGAGTGATAYRRIDARKLTGYAALPLTPDLLYGEVLAIAGVMRGGQGDAFIACVFLNDYVSEFYYPTWSGAEFTFHPDDLLFLRSITIVPATIRLVLNLTDA
jgi:hypothetical protein